MGTDMTAAFGHQVPFSATESIVEGMRKGIHPVGLISGREWDLLPDHKPGCGLVYVRGELRLYFGPHAALIGTGERWPRPSEHPDEKKALVSAVRAVARHFRSPRVIFLPDDIEPYVFVSKWIGEGLTLEEIQQRLALVGEPSPSLKAAIRQYPEYCQVEGYVVEQLDYDTV